MVKITNVLLKVADFGLFTILILFDLTVAFDIITHSIFLDSLAVIGFTDTIITCSYFSGCIVAAYMYIYVWGCPLPCSISLSLLYNQVNIYSSWHLMRSWETNKDLNSHFTSFPTLTLVLIPSTTLSFHSVNTPLTPSSVICGSQS